jgi:hypothetical protein
LTTPAVAIPPRAREPAEPLLFPAAHLTLGLSQRSKDCRRRVAEMFFASWARAVQCTVSGRQLVQNCEPHLPGWVARPLDFRIRYVDLAWSLAQLHPGTIGEIVISQVDICDCPLNWCRCLWAANSASWTASSASAPFPRRRKARR